MIQGLRFNHISFDLDGTLLDTLEVMRKSWEATMDKFHIPNDFSEYRREVGLPFPLIMQALGIVDEEHEIAQFYFRQTEQLLDEVKLYLGAKEFLRRLHAEEISTSIVTSKPRANTESLLDKFELEVSQVVCGDDPVGAKPDVAPMNFIRDRLGLAEDDLVLYFGDMLNDIMFCVNSGVEYCHCNFGIYGSLPKYLVPATESIHNWKDSKLVDLGFTDLDR